MFNVVEFSPLSYGGRVLPDWSQAVGWLMAITSVAMIPLFAVYQYCRLSSRAPYNLTSFCPVRASDSLHSPLKTFLKLS